MQETSQIHFPILQELINPYIKSKHWKLLQNALYPDYLTEQNILSLENTSLQDLLQAHILSHLPLLHEITSSAQAEFEEE